jgi:hypothetical protein
MKKAAELGVQVIDETTFRAMMGHLADSAGDTLSSASLSDPVRANAPERVSPSGAKNTGSLFDEIEPTLF